MDKRPGFPKKCDVPENPWGIGGGGAKILGEIKCKSYLQNPTIVYCFKKIKYIIHNFVSI